MRWIDDFYPDKTYRGATLCYAEWLNVARISKVDDKWRAVVYYKDYFDKKEFDTTEEAKAWTLAVIKLTQ
jgi:hypothetical protein